MKMNKTTQIWYWLSGRTPDFLCFTKTCDHKHILRSAAIEEWPGCRPGWDPAWTTQIWGPVLWWRPDRPAQCLLGRQSSPWGMETRYDRHASKRSNPSKCNIWQDITPLLVLVKVVCIVLLKGLWRAVDACLRDQQVGFRRQSLEYQQRISLNFINFVKAFDSVHRETLLKIAQAYGIPSWFVDIFRKFTKALVAVYWWKKGQLIYLQSKLACDKVAWHFILSRHQLCCPPLHRPPTHRHTLNS